MSRGKLLQSIVGLTLVMSFVVGCGAPAATPEPTSTPTLVLLPPTPIPPNATPIPLKATPTTAPTPSLSPLSISDIRLLTTPEGVLLFLNDVSTGGAELYATSGEKIVLMATSIYPMWQKPDVPPHWQVSPNGAMIADFTGDESGLLQVIGLKSPISTAQLTTYRIPDIYTDPKERIIWTISWSPDSTRLLVTTGCNVFVLSLDAGEFTLIEAHCPPVVPLVTGPLNATWSPDGTKIAYDLLEPSLLPSLVQQLNGGRPSILVIASADGKAKILVDEYGSNPVWSPDSQWILYTGGYRRSGQDVFNNEKLYIVQGDGSNRLQIHSLIGKGKNPPYYTDLGWSSDSAKVFFNTDGKLIAMQPDDTHPTTLSENAVKSFYVPSVNRIVWLEEFGEVLIGDLEGNSRVSISSTHSPDRNNVVWCGNWIALENDGFEWVISNLDGSVRTKLPSPPAPRGIAPKLLPVFSPGCTGIVFFNYATWGYAISDPTGENSRQLTEAIPYGLSIVNWVSNQP